MLEEEQFLFYSDFNRPFCYALHERISAMGDMARVQWRGIQHMPMASSQNPTLADQSRLISEVGLVRKRAPEVSIITPGYRPSTDSANKLVSTLSTQNPGRLQKLKSLIFKAYWVEGKDISQESVLKPLCGKVNLAWPEDLNLSDVSKTLSQWQREWEGDKFQSRIPAMVSMQQQDKPILGFPTFELISNFFAGTDLPVAADSFAACIINRKQNILLLGDGVRSQCNVLELEASYEITDLPTIEKARKWLAAQPSPPDMVVIDAHSASTAALEYYQELRSAPDYRQAALVVLLKEPNMEQELAAFDAGATDVMFDLSSAKVCQARLDMHLRMKRNATLLTSLSSVDYLTELPNRREFERRLETEWLRAVRSNKLLSIVIFDIDHFKLFNDTYGHSMGDDCLRQIAGAMAQCLKRPADILARYGGEEFVALLPSTDLAGARMVAGAMIEAVQKLQLDHKESPTASYVTISAGLATVLAQTGSAPRTPVELADRALYQAKRNGRDQLVIA